jgi:cytochrome c biogenesis protein CcmG/thiol:disulfide interchange protein DsbE
MDAPTITTKAGRRSTRPGAAPGGGPAGRRGRLTNLAIVGITGAIILAVAYMANQPAPGSSTTFTKVNVGGLSGGGGPTVGQLAPDFKANTDQGKSVQLSSFIGSPVWLTFGASWCQPCRSENPDIQAAWDKYKDKGLVLVQVFYTEDQATVTRYADTVGITYTRIPDPDSRLAGAYRIMGIPTHFFIDKTGVLHQITSSTLDPAAIDTVLKEIMG